MSIYRNGSAEPRQHGLSLIELIIAIVVVTVAVVGTLQVLNVTTRHSGDPQIRKQALSIAEGLLEEVELAHFTYCDPSDPAATLVTTTSPALCTIVENVGQGTGGEPVTARPFDNVNDYVTAFGAAQNTFNNGGATLRDATGNPIAVTGNYTATVTIAPDAGLGPAASPIPSNATPATTNVLRITVSVSNGNETVMLDGYRTRYAPTSVP